jgi:PAS domain S-box-containing protein
VSDSDRPDSPNPDSQSALLFGDGLQRFRDGRSVEEFAGSSGMLFEQAMAQTRMAICLSDPNQPDNPIVFANRAFLSLTGYSEEDVLGKNCRFLQGPDTDPEPIARLREAIAREDVVIVEMLNYRKDGSSFWNALHVGPIYDDTGKLVYFFGSQWDVSDLHVARAREQHARLMARELSHRMKNMFAVISAIVNVTGRVRGIEAPASEITSRIQALGRAYETTLDEAGTGTSALDQAVRATLEPYGDRVTLRGPEIQVAFTVVSVISLILHELAANAGKYGAWAHDEGRVEVSWRDQGGAIALDWRERDGPPVAQSDPIAGAGTQIADRLLRAAMGRIERCWHRDGLEVLVTLPLNAKGGGTL